MAINTALNRDPFATGGVMDAPDKAVTVAMNKIALGMQLTPQELGRLATRQKLEQQSGAVAAQRANFQSLIGQAPIDVRSYKGSMWAGANPQEDQANAALEARFGKRVPGQIDISYGAPAGGAQNYAPAYAPTTGLLGQSQGSQPNVRAAQAPANYPTALDGQPYGIRANPIHQTGTPSPATGLIGQAAPSGAPNPVSSAKPAIGAPNPVSSDKPWLGTPGAPPPSHVGPQATKQQQEGYGGIMGLIESLKGIPTPSADRIGEIARNVGMLPATVSNYIMGGSRRMREGIAERADILSGARAVRNQSDEDQKSQLAGIDKEIQGLLPSAGQAGVSGRIDYLRRLRERTVGSTSSSLMKLPGDIGAAQYATGAAQDATGAAQDYSQDYREPAAQVQAPPVPAAANQQSTVSQKPATAQSASMDDFGVPSAPYGSNVNVRYAPNSSYNLSNQGLDDLGLRSPSVQSASIQGDGGMSGGAPAAPVDNRPTRIYAFGSGDPIGQSPSRKTNGYGAQTAENTVSSAIASSPAQRGAAIREAEFQNTRDQQKKKELDAAQEKRIKNIGNAVALDPNTNLSGLSKDEQNAARVAAAKIRKDTGLEDQENNAAYGKAIEETKDIPAGPERISAMLASFVSSGGKVNPQMVKNMEDLAGAKVEMTKLNGVTIIRAGNSFHFLDGKNSAFEVNRADKQVYSSILIDTAQKYGSWSEVPVGLKVKLMELDELHPKSRDPITGEIPGPDEAFDKYRKLIVGAPPAPAPRAPQAAKPGQARPATKPSVPAVNPPPGFSVKP